MSSEQAQPPEAIIRDELAMRLTPIEEGLVLEDVEHYLPNQGGARGFVDILARDRFGMLVLIEIKRSTASSREALQELFKYVDLVVKNHGINRNQLRCLIISTSWHELAGPFSELSRCEALQLEGFQLEVDAAGIPTRVVLVDASSPDTVELYPSYMFVGYREPGDRNLVSAHLADFARDRGNLNALIVKQDYEGLNSSVTHRYGITLCVGRIDATASWQNNLQGVDDDDDSSIEWDFIVSAINAAPTSPGALRVRGAFQFVAGVRNGWRPVQFIRAGPWEKSTLWTPEALVRIVSGYESTNGIFLQFFGTPKNQLDWKMRLRQVEELFAPDPQLQKLTLALLIEFAKQHRRGTVAFDAFYPEDLLFALCGPVLSPINVLSPQIDIVLVPAAPDEEPVPVTAILAWSGKEPDGNALATLESIYRSPEEYQLVSVLHDHFRYRRSALSKLGLRWRVLEASEETVHELVVRNRAVTRRRVESTDVLTPTTFAARNWNWICDLVAIIIPEYPEDATPCSSETYFHDGPTVCDYCKRPFNSRIYDARLPPNDVAGFLCRECFVFRGCAKPSSSWQEFARLDDGKWYLTHEYSGRRP